jgi:hypothetical protein
MEAEEIALVGRKRHVDLDLKAVRTAIGTALRSLHSDVLQEPIPDRIAELLRQLDQQLNQLDRPKDADSAEEP